MPERTAAANRRFLAIGDSYTIGEGVAESSRWPNQLAARLRAQGLALGDPEIIATTGWSTDELQRGIEERAPQPPYALVSLLIGVNNQYRGRSPENYRDEFSNLLERAVTLAEGRPQRVVVVSIPDWGVTRFAREQGADPSRVAAAIDHFNRVNRGLAERASAHWVDVTDISRQAGAGLLVGDGLHPSAEQYALWAERILPVAMRALAS